MYCTLTDIEKELPAAKVIELTDDENAGAVNTGRVTEATAKADSLIDAYCAGRYTVPFAAPPQIVKTLSVSLSIYNLYKRRGRISDTLQEQYKNDLRLLESISKGTITLGVAQPSAASPVDAAEVADVDDTGRTFSQETLGNF